MSTPDTSPSAASSKPKTARWRYVVPNAITCASLLVGLAAIAMAFLKDGYVEAAWLVTLSVLLDKLDGTAARALNATSDIGVQLDSFSDFVTFGIAPGTMLFAAGLKGNLGDGALWAGESGHWFLGAACATYVLCACIRLAKFNVLSEDLPPHAPKVFYGMPTTFSGAIVALLYILADKYQWGGLLGVLPLITAVLGLLMVSSLALPKLVPRKNKLINILQILAIVATYIFGLLRIFPEFLAGLVVIYAVVGFGWGLVNRKELMRYSRLDPYPDA